MGMDHASEHGTAHVRIPRSGRSIISQPLKFKIDQAASTIFLAAAIFSFPTDVDPAFALGAWANFLISAMHHGFMVQTRPHHQLRLFGRSYTCACSGVDEWRQLLRILTIIDQAIVGYICLYTGCAGLRIPHLPSFILAVCLLSACLAGNAGIGGVISIALYLTVPKVVDSRVSHQALFAVAAGVGPICFLCMYKLGAWCTPHRYLWHLSCGCLVSVGGDLNSVRR
mmetsp:Transcript_11153/g.27418  ORF Transcript_11153/g.27418 Transcript_11153/m.27418 type:complete len:226 (+) Transcript_11153:175-852(+)